MGLTTAPSEPESDGKLALCAFVPLWLILFPLSRELLYLEVKATTGNLNFVPLCLCG
jgi:hypothetical protein